MREMMLRIPVLRRMHLHLCYLVEMPLYHWMLFLHDLPVNEPWLPLIWLLDNLLELMREVCCWVHLDAHNDAQCAQPKQSERRRHFGDH